MNQREYINQLKRIAKGTYTWYYDLLEPEDVEAWRQGPTGEGEGYTTDEYYEWERRMSQTKSAAKARRILKEMGEKEGFV